MYFEEGLDYATMSKILDETAATMRKRVSDGLRYLRRMLELPERLNRARMFSSGRSPKATRRASARLARLVSSPIARTGSASARRSTVRLERIRKLYTMRFAGR